MITRLGSCPKNEMTATSCFPDVFPVKSSKASVDGIAAGNFLKKLFVKYPASRFHSRATGGYLALLGQYQLQCLDGAQDIS